jgi:hypothetical protein
MAAMFFFYGLLALDISVGSSGMIIVNPRCTLMANYRYVE